MCVRGQDARDTINQGWKHELMGRRNNKAVSRLKRRRVDDSISSSLAYKHNNSSKYKDIQEPPVFNERSFLLHAKAPGPVEGVLTMVSEESSRVEQNLGE